MSLFKKLLGTETPSEIEAHADEAVASGEFGSAKIYLELALEKLGDAGDEERLRLRRRCDAMCDRIAETRLDLATHLLGEGSEDDALAEIAGAARTAVSDDVLRRARYMAERIAMRRAMHPNEAPTRESRADKVAAITRAWTEAQTEEYDAYGDAVIDAALALHDGHAVRSRDLFERVLGVADAPRWLHRDLAAARAAAGDAAGAARSLERFLLAVRDDDASNERDEAAADLARLRASAEGPR